MTSTDPVTPEPPGPFAHSLAWLAAALKYGRARAALAGIEAREAGLHYGVVFALFVTALLLVLIGYVFLIVAAVFGVAQMLGQGVSWISVMAVAAVLHMAAAVALALIARRRLKAAAFPLTAAELKKDQLWLTNLANRR